MGVTWGEINTLSAYNVDQDSTHALNDNWSLNASYNLGQQPRANAHNASVGATYRF